MKMDLSSRSSSGGHTYLLVNEAGPHVGRHIPTGLRWWAAAPRAACGCHCQGENPPAGENLRRADPRIIMAHIVVELAGCETW